MILSDPNVEIRRATESVMGEFLKEITEHPDKVDFAAMVNILIQHSQPKQVKFFFLREKCLMRVWAVSVSLK